MACGTEPLCADHTVDVCAACLPNATQAALVPTIPTTVVASTTLFFPTGDTIAYAMLGASPKEPGARGGAQEDEGPEGCALRDYVHCTLLLDPADSAVLRVEAGQLLAVRRVLRSMVATSTRQGARNF